MNKGGISIKNIIISLLLAICLFLYINNTQQSISVPQVTQSTPSQAIIEKDLVVENLKANYQIVGSEVEFVKEHEYEDSLLTTTIQSINPLWKRQFKIVAKGTAKFGFNIEEIKPDHIFVTEDTVKIISPEVVMISFEMPYDEMEIVKTVGLLRGDFTEQDRQDLYRLVKDKAKKEMLEDEEVLKAAKRDSQKAIEKILKSIPGVKKVEFIEI